MKIFCDKELVIELNDTQKKVIKNDIQDEVFGADIKNRISWILQHKYEQCFERLKREWEPKLKERGIKMIPTDSDEYAELIFSQADYKSRSQRESV